MKDPLVCVEQLMSKDVRSCRAEDSLAVAARLMWEHDCGCAPIVDQDGALVGMVTDRDICMAAYTQSRAISEIPISAVMARALYTVSRLDTLPTAEAIMQERQIRRLPVVDARGRLVGILSLNDLARAVDPLHARPRSGLSADAVELTLAAIGRPRSSPAPLSAA